MSTTTLQAPTESFTHLPDGQLGYFQRTPDDCLRAATATACQVPYGLVPDTEPRGNKGKADELRVWEGLFNWANARGLRVRFHETPPVERDVWIAVTPRAEDGYRHTVVMSGGEILFDPASGFRAPQGYRVAPSHVFEFGISFESIGAKSADGLGLPAVDVPRRLRLVVDDDSGQDQRALIWGFRSRHYSGSATAALEYEAEELQALDTAVKVALSGASGGTVVQHGTISTSWTPVVGTNIGGSTYLTHTGTYRAWIRAQTTSGTAVEARFVYDVGDLVNPVENDQVTMLAGTLLQTRDLGEVRLDKVPVGTHRWQGQVQARGQVGNENFKVDKLWLQPLDEGGGVLRAPIEIGEGLVTYSARDEFNQSSGALTGKTAAVGGTWAGAGDTDDFSVESTGTTAQRTATLDADTITGRYATLPVSLTTTYVQADFKVNTLTNSGLLHGVLARYTNTQTWWAALIEPLENASVVRVYKRNGATATLVYTVPVAQLRGRITADKWMTLGLYADASGRWAAFFGDRGAALSMVANGDDSLLATGGALASGNPGIYDVHTGTAAVTRNTNNLAAWVPTNDAVILANQSLEMRHDGMVREDSGGTAYGPVSWVEGDLARIPPAGLESRTLEVFLKASRGDADKLPDDGIDDISARLTYRPSWLFIPEP